MEDLGMSMRIIQSGSDRPRDLCSPFDPATVLWAFGPYPKRLVAFYHDPAQPSWPRLVDDAPATHACADRGADLTTMPSGRIV
jgi:hypothetical protein